MNKETIHVLMTGAGAPGAAGIIRCLQEDTSVKLTVADADENAVGKYLAGDFIKIPKAGDKSFIEKVLNICLQKNINIVLPLVTRELFPFSKNKELFLQNNIQVLVSDYNAIEIANDKSKCYRFLQSKGIAIPQFVVANTVENFKDGVTKLGYPGKAVCFKPSIANGSRGFRIITDDIDEADLLFNYKPNNTYLDYQTAISILSSKPFPELLVSEFLPGDEYSVDCIANNGKTVLVVPRLRQKMINGISVQGEFVNDRKIINYCSQIIEVIGLHGNIGIQVKRRENGEALLLEINPRVQGTIVSAFGAGVNLPLLALKQQLNIPIQNSELEIKWNTRFSRYWTEIYY